MFNVDAGRIVTLRSLREIDLRFSLLASGPGAISRHGRALRRAHPLQFRSAWSALPKCAECSVRGIAFRLDDYDCCWCCYRSFRILQLVLVPII